MVISKLLSFSIYLRVWEGACVCFSPLSTKPVCFFSSSQPLRTGERTDSHPELWLPEGQGLMGLTV